MLLRRHMAYCRRVRLTPRYSFARVSTSVVEEHVQSLVQHYTLLCHLPLHLYSISTVVILSCVESSATSISNRNACLCWTKPKSVSHECYSCHGNHMTPTTWHSVRTIATATSSHSVGMAIKQPLGTARVVFELGDEK